MCILFIYKASSASATSLPYKLILAANRDEFYNRPSKEACFWENSDADILGGRDLQSGGTWLAVNRRTGKLGVLLNIMGGTKGELSTSRGSLITNFLRSPKHLTGWTYCRNLIQDPSLDIVNNFSLFNLVLFDLLGGDNTKSEGPETHQRISRDTSLAFPTITYLTNFNPNETRPLQSEPEQISSNFFSICNSHFSKPFKKTKAGQEIFERIVNSAETSSIDELKTNLLELLKTTQEHYPDVELQRQGQDKPEAILKGLSSVFLAPAAFNYLYGTRTHTIALVDNDNNVHFHEWTLTELPTKEASTSTTWKESTFTFRLGNTGTSC